jgi:hypothetical protein
LPQLCIPLAGNAIVDLVRIVKFNRQLHLYSNQGEAIMKKQRRGQAQNLLNNNQPILDESSRLKLEIDQKRLDLEIEKFKRENSFWHKFGGNIIQAVVGNSILELCSK